MEKYEIIFGDKKIEDLKDFIKLEIEDLEIIPVILKIEKKTRIFVHGNDFREIIAFFTSILEKRFKGLYNIIITADLKEILTDKSKKDSFKKPIQVCFLDEKIIEFDSRKSMWEFDYTIVNLKNLLKKQMEKGYFFLITPIFAPGRPGEGFIRSLRCINQILYIKWY